MTMTEYEKNEHIFAFLTSISVTGTIGNLIVAFVYLNKRNDKQTSTFFIQVLALNDLLVCSLLVPLTIYMERSFFETNSLLLCKANFFLSTSIVPFSCLLMTSIAFDRYCCICVLDRNVLNLFRARVLVACLYVFSALLGVIPSLNAVLVELDHLPPSPPSPAHSTNQTSHQQFSLTHEDGLLEDSLNQTDPAVVDVIVVNQCIINDNTTNNRSHSAHLVMPFKLFIHDCIYCLSVLLITLLYALIYKEIRERKRIKMKRKMELLTDFSEAFTASGLDHNLRIESVCLGRGMVGGNKTTEHPIEMNKMKAARKSETTAETAIKKSDNEKKVGLSFIRFSKSVGSHSSSSRKKRHRRQRTISLFKRESTFNSKIIPFLVLIRETRTAFVLFIVSIVFMACYMPSILATRSILPNDNLYLIYLYFANSALNPLIYSFINRSFRADLKKRLSALAKCMHLYYYHPNTSSPNADDDDGKSVLLSSCCWPCRRINVCSSNSNRNATTRNQTINQIDADAIGLA